MKALICTATLNVEIVSPNPAGKWTQCPCGNAWIRWLNPSAGTAIVYAIARERVAMLGLNNRTLHGFLLSETPVAAEDFQKLHELGTIAPGYLFDKSKFGCWAVLFRVGASNDVRWANGAECAELISKYQEQG